MSLVADTIRFVTSKVKDLKNNLKVSVDQESDSETDEEDDEQMLEVEAKAERLEKRISCYDTSKIEDFSACITVLLIVYKNGGQDVKSLTVCIAGAVVGVKNCFKRVGQTVVNITTLWIYNKELRLRLETEWKTKGQMFGSLPHKALTSPELDSNQLCVDPKLDSQGCYISFEMNNIRIKHSSPDFEKSQTKEWRWIVELTPGDAASGACHTLASGSTRNRELESEGTKFKEEAQKKMEQYKKASFYPRIMTTKHLTDQQESAEVIATMSFTTDGNEHQRFNSLAILSIGEQSQFVDPPDELGMAKIVSNDIRRKLGPSRNWGIYTCAVQGVESDVRSLKEVINQHWGQTENGPLADIACHAVYIGDREREFENQKSMGGEKIKLTGLKRKRNRKQCDVDIHSHRPRNQALHDELMESNPAYSMDWNKLTLNEITDFFETHCKTLILSQDHVVSFQYPTIQIGFATCDKPAQTSARNHMIYFSNDDKSTAHHKFPSSTFGPPRSPDSEEYFQFLLEKINKMRNQG